MGGMEAFVLSEFFIIFLVSFLSGVVSSMGFGGGGVLLLYLTIFAGVPQLTAQGINLIFFVPTALAAVIIYSIKKQIDYKRVLPFVLGGVPTTLLTGYLIKFINTDILGKLFGAFVLTFGLWQLFRKEKGRKSTESKQSKSG